MFTTIPLLNVWHDCLFLLDSVLLQLAQDVIAQDTSLGLGYLLALPKVTNCFGKLSVGYINDIWEMHRDNEIYLETPLVTMEIRFCNLSVTWCQISPNKFSLKMRKNVSPSALIQPSHYKPQPTITPYKYILLYIPTHKQVRVHFSELNQQVWMTFRYSDMLLMKLFKESSKIVLKCYFRLNWESCWTCDHVQYSRLANGAEWIGESSAEISRATDGLHPSSTFAGIGKR